MINTLSNEVPHKKISRFFLFILLFCYVFAFYIANISVSILIAAPLYGYALLSKRFLNDIIRVLKSSYLRKVFIGWGILVFLSLLFPVLYGTYDLSFFRVVGAQLLHFVAALPVFAFLKYQNFSYKDVERTFVYLFVVQTIIQCIALMNPVIGEIMLYFNKFDLSQESGGLGSGIRGKALAAATTYHLSLVYGIGFLIYVKEFLSYRISFKNVLIGILIFVGIFFAGRTGFVGVGIGMLAFIFSRRIGLWQKLKMFFYVLIGIFAFILFLDFAFPEFYELLSERVLPYAFEFIYSLDNSGQIETASTNQLMEMWSNRDFDYFEILLGSGKYTLEDGSYYMGVDPGILRHTLFMGILGYLTLFIYQLLLLPVWRMEGKSKYYYSLILLYLCFMEFKGATIGVNKFVFATALLLSYSYFELKNKQVNSARKCVIHE